MALLLFVNLYAFNAVRAVAARSLIVRGGGQ